MRKRRYHILARAGLAIAVAVGLVLAAIGPQPAEAKPLFSTLTTNANFDTTLHNLSGETGYNFGAYAYIFAGQYTPNGEVNRAIVAFDLSSIPAGATINSASISLYLEQNYAGVTRDMRAYRILRDAGEGTQSGSGCTGTGATWVAAKCGTVNWGTAGAANTSTDREATDVGSMSVTSAQTTGQYYTLTLSTSAVAGMISGGGFTNRGFLLQMDTESNDLHYWSSREGSHAPYMTVDYTVPPTATPTNTATPTSTLTPTPTRTPTPTLSPTPGPTSTPTPTSTNEPIGFQPSAPDAGNNGGLSHNFWYWILNAITDFLITFFLPFLPRHVDWGIAEMIAKSAGPILLIFYLGVGSFVHLATLFRIILLLLMMEGVKGILAYRKIVARIIKYATLVGLLG